MACRPYDRTGHGASIAAGQAVIFHSNFRSLGTGGRGTKVAKPWRRFSPLTTTRNTMRAILVAAFVLAVLPAGARAEQRYAGGHVVHTRLAPVIAHRVVPPFKGVHVYEGRRR